MRRAPFPKEYLSFFLPLAVQGVAQSLTHPLVAMVSSHGPGGALALAGQGQAGSLMFLLQTLNLGLLTTGMVFGRTRGGFRVFLGAWATLGAVTVSAQIVAAIPAVSHWLFAGVIGLPPGIEGPARISFATGILARFLFHLRMPFQVILLNNRASSRASAAAIGRVALALLLAPLFVRTGLVGNFWGEVCLAISALFELVAVAIMARPYLARFVPETPAEAKPSSVRGLIAFTLPLSLGSTILSLSGNLLSAFMARAPSPEIVLPVYQLALTVTGTLSYASTQVERVVVAFAPGSLADRSTTRFAAAVGIVTGLLPLLFQLEPLRSAYFVTVQNLPRERLGSLGLLTVLLTGQGLVIAMRSRLTGVASSLGAPAIVLGGNAALLAAMTATGAFCLSAGVPGLLIGPLGMYVSNAAAILTMTVLARRRVRQPAASAAAQ